MFSQRRHHQIDLKEPVQSTSNIQMNKPGAGDIVQVAPPPLPGNPLLAQACVAQLYLLPLCSM